MKDIADLGITTSSDVRVVDVYWLDADLTPEQVGLIAGYLLADPVTQEYTSSAPSVKSDISVYLPHHDPGDRKTRIDLEIFDGSFGCLTPDSICRAGLIPPLC